MEGSSRSISLEKVNSETMPPGVTPPEIHNDPNAAQDANLVALLEAAGVSPTNGGNELLGEDIDSLDGSATTAPSVASPLDRTTATEDLHNTSEKEKDDHVTFTPQEVTFDAEELKELKKHRYIDEDDEVANATDLQFKIKQINAALSGKMKEGINDKKKNAKPSSALAFEQDALRHGVDIQQLKDIKVAFDMAGSRGIPGVPEEEFMEMFGPTLCAGMNEEQVRLWFRTIDANCSGAVSWSEISHYLSEYRSGDKNKKDPFVDYTIEPHGMKIARRKHKQAFNHMIYNPALDCVYTGGNDGIVQGWSPDNLRALIEPVHEGNVWINGLVHLPHNNRLMILKDDRSIFVYDTFLNKNQRCHELYRAFATDGKSVKKLSDGTPFYDSKREVANPAIATKPKFMNLAQATMTPVSLLEASSDGILCIDHLGGAITGEPIVCGMESGQLHLTNLLVGSSKPIKPHTKYKAHDGWITACKYAPELGGIITSSLDEYVCVTDLEKGYNLHRMAPTKRKPIFGFDYTKFHNTLVTASGRTVHVWNALTGAKLTSLHDHESPVTKVTLNASQQVCYALMENKTVKVWDLRTWKTLGIAADTMPRYPSNQLNTLLWLEEHHTLLSGCTELFGWRPTEVQERIDAGLSPVSSNFHGHLHPLKDIHIVESSGHITAIDTQNIAIWGAERKKIMSQWKWPDLDDQLTCSAFDPEGVRLLVGTETGKVAWYNYACGHKMYTLKHDVPNVGVNCCLVLPGVSGGPPIAIVGVGNSILGWVADKVNVFDLPGPTSRFVFEEDEDAIATGICVADEERQILAASFSTGTIVILTLGLAMLHEMDFTIPPEFLRSISPCVFLSGHSDGTIKFNVVNTRTYHTACVANIMASQQEEEAATDIAVAGEKIFVSDATGCITAFRCRKLLDGLWMKRHLIPSLFQGEQRYKHEAAADILLIRCFLAHKGSCVGLAVHKEELFSAGSDRHLRCWSTVSVVLKEEMGNSGTDAVHHPLDYTKTHPFRKERPAVSLPAAMSRMPSFLPNITGSPKRKSDDQQRGMQFPAEMEKREDEYQLSSTGNLSSFMGSLGEKSISFGGLTKALSFTRLATKGRIASRLADIEQTTSPPQAKGPKKGTGRYSASTTPQSTSLAPLTSGQPSHTTLGHSLGLNGSLHSSTSSTPQPNEIQPPRKLAPITADDGHPLSDQAHLSRITDIGAVQKQKKAKVISPSNRNRQQRSESSVALFTDLQEDTFEANLLRKQPSQTVEVDRPKMDYKKPGHIDLYKMTTDRVLQVRSKLRFQRTIPLENTVEMQLMEVAKIREERAVEVEEAVRTFGVLDLPRVQRFKNPSKKR